MPRIKSGLRGIRYFIEFPIAGKNIDAFSLILQTEKAINRGKEKHGSRILTTDSFSKGDNVSYLIDYHVNSSQAPGSKSKGSVYIRGVRAENGYDSFKFVLEKSVDFSELDSDIVLAAISETAR